MILKILLLFIISSTPVFANENDDYISKRITRCEIENTNYNDPLQYLERIGWSDCEAADLRVDDTKDGPADPFVGLDMPHYKEPPPPEYEPGYGTNMDLNQMAIDGPSTQPRLYEHEGEDQLCMADSMKRHHPDRYIETVGWAYCDATGSDEEALSFKPFCSPGQACFTVEKFLENN